MERKEFLIVSVIVLAGSLIVSAGSYSLFIKPIVQVVDARVWPGVPCVIVSSKVVSRSGEGTSYSIKVSYEYEVQGKRYLSSRYGFFPFEFGRPRRAQEIVNRLPPGRQTVCHVNRRNPREAVINRGLSSDLWWGLIPVVLLLFLAPGIYGLLMRIYLLLRGRPSEPDLSNFDGHEMFTQIVGKTETVAKKSGMYYPARA